MTTGEALPAALTAWIEEVAGGRVAVACRRPGGGRREAWSVDVQHPDGSVAELFLRRDATQPGANGDPFTLDREARFYAALQGTGVPVPRLVGSHPQVQAILTERVPGEAWFSLLRDERERESVARDFMRRLAALHAVDPARVDLPGEPRGSVRECVQHEIARWERLYRFGDPAPDPVLEFGFDWLRRHLPDADGPPVVVQGDTGPGNFLYRDGRVTAVLDWELAHLGDPMEDLAWLALRATQEPFTVLADRLADYAAFSGRPVDLDRLRYHRVFAEFKVVVLGFRRALDGDLLGEVGNGLIYETLHRTLFAEALAELHGVDVPEVPDLAPDPGEREQVFDAVLAQLRHVVVPALADPFAARRAKGVARMVKYLREADRCGADAARRELAALQPLVGERPASVAEGRSALVAALGRGIVPDAAVVGYLVTRTRLELALMRPAMGRLAQRRHDPLT